MLAPTGLAGRDDHPDEGVAVIPAPFGVLRGRQPVPVGLSLECPRLDRGRQGRAGEPVMEAGGQPLSSSMGKPRSV